MDTIKTCEFVSPRHPDKICDLIADSILDACLLEDPESRVAVEALGGHGVLTISGEITTNAKIDAEKIVRKIVGRKYRITANISRQSPFIGQGVAQGGAGDQGIMIGYATRETKNFMPLEYELARNLCRGIYAKYPRDSKVQVTIRGKKVLAVVASVQGTKTMELKRLVRQLIRADDYFINPAGEWKIGGFDADSGLTGRKTVIDSYGPEVPIGGGSFSGKDPTKVDRSGAYMARKIAVDLLKRRRAQKVLVKLAYAIGKAEPLMALADIDGMPISLSSLYDCTPKGMITLLNLNSPLYAETACWGHFGRNFLWDQ